MGNSAIVVGAGIAGLTSAIALRQAGWTVRIIDRASRLDPLGAALSLWPNAVEGLRRLDVLPALEERAAPIKAMLVADRAGRAILGPQKLDELAVVVRRADLQDALLQRFGSSDVELGREIVKISSITGGAQVEFKNRKEAFADLVIDAAGIRSIGSNPHDVSYRGYGGILAVSGKVDSAPLDGLAAEYWGDNARFGLFELSESQRYWFYMRTRSANTIMPTKAFVAKQAVGWPEVISDAIHATSEDRFIPVAIHARPAPKSLGNGCVIRVGDAAHAMEPNLGQGACQGIEDAVALGRLAGTLPPYDILAAFEKERLKRIRMVVSRAAEGKFGAHGPLLIRTGMRGLLRCLPRSISTKMSRRIHSFQDP